MSQQSSQFFATVVAEGDGGMSVAQRTPVKLGQLQDNHYEVLGGLKQGTPVIIGSLQAIRDGQPIEPKPAKPRPEQEEQGVGGAANTGTGEPTDAGTAGLATRARAARTGAGDDTCSPTSSSSGPSSRASSPSSSRWWAPSPSPACPSSSTPTWPRPR
ncbi:hypothetical protein ACN28S_64615 [Cystobacter fuscus]